MKGLQPEHPWSLAKRRSVLVFGTFATLAAVYVLSGPEDTPRPSRSAEPCAEVATTVVTLSGLTLNQELSIVNPNNVCDYDALVQRTKDLNSMPLGHVADEANKGKNLVEPVLAATQPDTTGATLAPSDSGS